MDLIDALTLAAMVPASEDTRVARLVKETLSTQDWLPGAGPGVVDQVASALGLDSGELVAAARTRAARAVERAGQAGLTAVPFGTPAYPPWLAEIVDPPIVLWVRGRLPEPPAPTVAIVGSRHATPAGLTMARLLAGGLAAAGVTVVSGLARGVDGAAHEGALAAGGITLAVLGCGADVVYPAEHRRLAGEVAETGAVLSEFPPGTGPRPYHFPLRNRIIAGLSRAVVVIEAGEKSGSLITARLALEQGRDVLAVPGNVPSGRSRGCHALIKDGARLVETVGDILDELGWSAPETAQSKTLAKPLSVNDLDVRMAPGEVYDADTLAAVTGWAPAKLLAELAALEVDGRLARVPGGWTRVLT